MNVKRNLGNKRTRTHLYIYLNNNTRNCTGKEKEKKKWKNNNPKTTATDHRHTIGMSNICKMQNAKICPIYSRNQWPKKINQIQNETKRSTTFRWNETTSIFLVGHQPKSPKFHVCLPFQKNRWISAVHCKIEIKFWEKIRKMSKEMCGDEDWRLKTTGTIVKEMKKLCGRCTMYIVHVQQCLRTIFLFRKCTMYNTNWNERKTFLLLLFEFVVSNWFGRCAEAAFRFEFFWFGVECWEQGEHRNSNSD